MRILQTGFVHLLKVKPAGGTPFVVMYFVYIFLPHRLKLLFEKLTNSNTAHTPAQSAIAEGLHTGTHTPHPTPHSHTAAVKWSCGISRDVSHVCE